MGILWEKSLVAFLLITVVLGGGAAYLTGRAVARGWQSFGRAVFYSLLLAAVVRFLHWGLFDGATYESWRDAQGTLLSLHFYIADALVLIIACAIGFRLQRTEQMTRQYHWLYEKTSPFSWRLRQNATVEPQSGPRT